MTSPLKVGASNGVTAPTTEDRYSALKDLDALFTNTQTTPISEPSVTATPNWNSTWNTGTAQAVNVAAPPTHHQHHSESVFSSNGVDTSVAWSSFTPSNSNPSNPFLGKWMHTVTGHVVKESQVKWACYCILDSRRSGAYSTRYTTRPLRQASSSLGQFLFIASVGLPKHDLWDKRCLSSCQCRRRRQQQSLWFWIRRSSESYVGGCRNDPNHQPVIGPVAQDVGNFDRNEPFHG